MSDCRATRAIGTRLPGSAGGREHEPRPWRDVAAVTRCRGEAPFPPLQPDHLFFNVSLMPYATHPLVCERGQAARQQLSARRLADYLNKTERVELYIVNRAVEQMLGMPGIASVSRDDLLAIYTDEGFHTWMMERFRGHLLKQTGYALARTPSLSVVRVLALCEAVPATLRGMAIVAAATVTETLITGTLRQAGAGDDIYPPVRGMLSEHGADERRHQAAFIRFASEWVPSLSPAERAFLDALLPDLMTAFLAPELPAWRVHLCAVGLDDGEADRVIRESIDPLEVGVQMMEAALVPRRLFERLGMACAERFAQQASRWRLP
ncbi:diiron oxygenase [Pandoraea terrigena]|uniref:p-aminobenzoate N-oxygenase AurF n=1 Tax=Pandoraea terrigena TaxID=2508292 RepID=A0A5E4S248_9BURK|nr:diiron oxygenase [Pandoraea terrigena]VVD69660.1 P-aminobenzoate N-oxygenase AurF [Pandoraea terrigena]